ncbi:HipA domain-containing protein [Thiomicrospira sp. ALE5]|uniref:HipA domain-containing protein n=1 Tax=Thiomicrospira sp. ALE5 TaxID=748650 RepID=UPI0008F0B876|nr:HipA domain-containing protein [Thiomicrospira sp. ALE5]SFR62541.1 HipA-like N-terminal domain-containing protein [Thiomicrospira sp. ALE5]
MNVEDYLQSLIATSKQIQTACNLTQRQVGLQINKLGDRVVRIANGRSPKYALTTAKFGVGDSILIWEMDNFGKPTCIAKLRPLAAGGFFIKEHQNMPRVFLGEAKNGLFDDLPFFLVDMAPKGFLGKKIAEQLSRVDESFPAHLKDWKTEHIGRYLLANPDNSIGNLKFGNNAALQLHTPFTTHSRKEYITLADHIMDEDVLVSSAGGEHQKFATFCTDIDAHVIVKFSPKGNDANARRWKDVLITEHYAAKVLNETGFVTAAETHIFEGHERLFLESKRFDRSGKNGRRSMLSLEVIDAEFVGSGVSWMDSCFQLLQQGLLTEQDYIKVEFLSAFARYIHNTDTHLGNISFATHRDIFALLPIYDMCSMGFAPKSNGEVAPLQFSWPESVKVKKFGLNGVKHYATRFWKNLAQEPFLSAEFRQFINEKVIPQIPD